MAFFTIHMYVEIFSKTFFNNFLCNFDATTMENCFVVVLCNIGTSLTRNISEFVLKV